MGAMRGTLMFAARHVQKEELAPRSSTGQPQDILIGIAPKKSRLPISTPQWRKIA
jgi:hypothetical protein